MNTAGLEVGIALKYDEVEEELLGSVAGNFYLASDVYPLNSLEEIENMLLAFYLKDKDNFLFRKCESQHNIIENVLKSREIIRVYLDYLCVGMKDTLSELEYLKYKCMNEGCKIVDIVDDIVPYFTTEIAANMSEFFDYFVAQK